MRISSHFTCLRFLILWCSFICPFKQKPGASLRSYSLPPKDPNCGWGCLGGLVPSRTVEPAMQLRWERMCCWVCLMGWNSTKWGPLRNSAKRGTDSTMKNSSDNKSCACQAPREATGWNGPKCRPPDCGFGGGCVGVGQE